MKNPILTIFEQMADKRRRHLREYPLIEILFLVFCAVSSKQFTWEEIATFGKLRLDWLRKFLPYENGIPSHDTINRTLSLLSNEALEKCLLDWKNMEITTPAGTVINIDGKKIRRSVTSKQQQTKKAEGGKQAVQMLHAWSASLSVCLAQKQIADKHNEISDLPLLLDMLDIEGCIITADSMNCQRGTVSYIAEKKGHYVLGVKDNQPSLAASIRQAFETAEAEKQKMDTVSIIEKSHGRAETRICEVLPAAALLGGYDIDLWQNLTSIIRTKSIRKAPYKAETIEYRYHISSLPNDAKNLYSIIRGHWSVENQLHWVLDVCMGEDDSRKRQKNAAAVFSCIRKMVINILNSYDFSMDGFKAKLPITQKMTICLLSDEIRAKCFGVAPISKPDSA